MRDSGRMPYEIELAERGDVPRILEITNWAAEHTSANFATEPETIEQWTNMWETAEGLKRLPPNSDS